MISVIGESMISNIGTANLLFGRNFPKTVWEEKNGIQKTAHKFVNDDNLVVASNSYGDIYLHICMFSRYFKNHLPLTLEGILFISVMSNECRKGLWFGQIYAILIGVTNNVERCTRTTIPDKTSHIFLPPQRSCRVLMFSIVSVSHSVHRGSCSMWPLPMMHWTTTILSFCQIIKSLIKLV